MANYRYSFPGEAHAHPTLKHPLSVNKRRRRNTRLSADLFNLASDFMEKGTLLQFFLKVHKTTLS
jgi:hypothetical protein